MERKPYYKVRLLNLRIMYSVHFKKDLKMCLVNVKKRFFQKRT